MDTAPNFLQLRTLGKNYCTVQSTRLFISCSCQQL